MSARASVWLGTMLVATGLLGCAAEEHAPPAPPGGEISPSFVASAGSPAAADREDPPLPLPAGLGPAVTPLDGFLEGTLGDVDVSATPYRIDAYLDAGHVHLALFVEGDRGEAMVAIDLACGLDDPRIADGRPHTFSRDALPDPSGLDVSGIGCSGLRAPSWDWDRPASSVTVQVTTPSGAAEPRVELDVQLGTELEPAGHASGWVALAR